MFKKKIIDYKIVHANSHEELEHDVRSFLSNNGDGWEPHGGCTGIGEGDRILCVGQVMVKIKWVLWFTL